MLLLIDFTREKTMAPRRDFDALEHRRREAITLLRQHVHPAEVARRVGVSRQSVSRWQATLRTHGLRGLRRAPRAGRPPALTPADLKQVERALKAGPEIQGYATGLWTLARVGKLIEKQCGVRYSKPWVWHLLRRLGWSCQRPTGQARERDEAAIRRWKRVEWPRLKKTPPARGARSSSSTSRA
jgi:transposase